MPLPPPVELIANLLRSHQGERRLFPQDQLIELLYQVIRVIWARHGERVELSTEEEVYRNHEATEVAEGALRLVGAELGRRWLLGFSWAMETCRHEVTDMVRQAVLGELKQKIDEARKVEDYLAEQSRKAVDAALRVRAAIRELDDRLLRGNDS